MKPISYSLLTALLLILLMTGCGASRLSIVDYELSLVDNKASATSILAVQISDLHFKPGNELNEQVVRLVREIKPDIIFFTGDMIDRKENLSAFSDYIDAFPKAPHMYAIHGNWEYWSKVDLRALENIYASSGIRLLVNEEARLSLKGRTLRVIGLDDLLGGKPSLPSVDVDADQINIILAHCPQLYDAISKQIPENTRGVMLSGHTHGGQITFFGLPFRLPPGSGEYVAGLYHKSELPLVVSRGIGTSVKDFRLFAQPDISRIAVK